MAIANQDGFMGKQSNQPTLTNRQRANIYLRAAEILFDAPDESQFMQIVKEAIIELGYMKSEQIPQLKPFSAPIPRKRILHELFLFLPSRSIRRSMMGKLYPAELLLNQLLLARAIALNP